MTAPARYYTSRAGGPAAGPYTVAELRRLMNAQELGLDDMVCLEGSQEWLPLRGVRAIVPRDPGPAQPAAKQPLPQKAQGPPAAAKKPARPDSGYRPGAAPTLPGVYLPFAASAEELLLQLADLENPPAAPPDPTAPLRRTRKLLTVVLLGLSAAACVVDDRMGYPQVVFSMLTPFAWLGVIVAWMATRPPLRRPSGFKKRLGCGGLVLLPILFLGLQMFYWSTARVSSWLLWVLGSGVALLMAWGLSAVAKPPAAVDRESVLPRLRMVRRVLAALRDDVAPGKRVSGWLDLTGPDQPGKVVRSSKAASGAQVDLLRDEWWRLRLPLRDGNDLRVSGVTRVKERREFWKRNARGKSKRKLGRRQSLWTLEVRLAVNPAAYRIVPQQSQALEQVTPKVEGNALSIVVQTTEALETDDVLKVLAAFYRQLQPAAAGTGAAS